MTLAPEIMDFYIYLLENVNLHPNDKISYIEVAVNLKIKYPQQN
jgi:hypothetical protein